MLSSSDASGRQRQRMSPALPDDRLDSWKEIATYLGRGVRTVQRWEREEGLPVHRLAHEKRGNVYARREELAAWWERRSRTLAAQPDAADAGSAPGLPRLERATLTSAMTAWPALSSDARLIACVSDGGSDGMTPQIWLQQIGGSTLRLTTGEREYSHLSFSPDDTRIIFTVSDRAGQHVYEMPTLGGEPRLLQRDAKCGEVSPDGRWLACVPRDGVAIRVAARGGAGFRRIAAELVDVSCITWTPESRSVIVHARSGPAAEPDWWVVPVDGGPPVNTGVTRAFRDAGMFTLPSGVAWVDDSLVFAAAGARSKGVYLYRQRVAPVSYQAVGEPEQLTSGSEVAWLPRAAGRRLAFLSSRGDMNLWSVSVDVVSGAALGPLRRMTRGPAPTGYLSVTRDFRTLAYFSFRLGHGEIFLRDLETGSEKVLADPPEGERGYPAISPSGTQLAFGLRMPAGHPPARPIFVACPATAAWRSLGEDCGGRPRQWVDERLLMIERFARLNSIAIIDTETGQQREVLTSAERSITNARVSPDGRWVAFDAAPPGEPATVFVTRLETQAIPESVWVVVDRFASHPFWSADGAILYYTPTGTIPMVRSAVRGRRFVPETGALGEPITVYALSEMLMPAYLPGTAPLATPDQIILVLGDFRGDVWLMDLSSAA
jgi:Tol biopolymer transport system component